MSRISKKSILEMIEKVTDAFYQNHLQIGIKELPELIRNLAELTSIFDTEAQPVFVAGLKQSMEAMEQKDYILLADILVFEVGELIEQQEFE